VTAHAEPKARVLSIIGPR